MRRRLIVLAAALVLAVLSATMVLAYTGNADKRAVNGKKAVHVLLATFTIPKGTTVKQIRTGSLVRQVLMPAEAVPSGYLTSLTTAMNDQVLNADLQPDQMLLKGNFSAPVTPSPTPTFVIPEGKLAVSVALTAAPQVAGNVSTGDEVAVFCTFKNKLGDAYYLDTVPFLTHVQVITVGEAPQTVTVQVSVSASPAASGGVTVGPTILPSASPASISGLNRYIVTLAVDQSEAEQLLNASRGCGLSLGLLGSSASVSPQPLPTLSATS